MNLAQHSALHIRGMFFAGNWTGISIQESVSGLTWQQATTKIDSFNTIAGIAFHIHYYVVAIINELEGNPINAKDAYSFDHPPIKCQEDWDRLLDQIWADAETFIQLVEKLPEERYWQSFTDEKHGIFFRNIHGIIEHGHYHLGQITILKRLLPAFDSLYPD